MGDVAGLLLAAGAARRFGGDAQKLLARADSLGGRPLVRAAADTLAAAGLAPLLAVTGRDADAVAATLAGLDLAIVANPRYAEGMSTSLAAGIAALIERAPLADAVVIALGDQPAIGPAVIDALLARFRVTGAPIVAPVYRGTRGHPVLFARRVFPELLAVTGDRGARDVIARDPARVAIVPLDAPVPLDVDTLADLSKL